MHTVSEDELIMDDFEIISKEDLEKEMFGTSNSVKMKDLYNALPLPDDRPISAIGIVEEVVGCPANFKMVSKTHDQDMDADLCKDGFFKRVTRYLCFSKTEGFFGYVMENLLIVNEKESRPAGYTPIELTSDTNKKAFRNKQLCYKILPRNMATQIITDIIILGRSKIAPEGFTLAGEMNGLSVCYKHCSNPEQTVGATQPYGMNPSSNRDSISSTGSAGRMYPGLSDASLYPTRPAPQPPESNVPGAFPYSSPQHQSSEPTDLGDTYCNAQSALFGVPFVVNEKFLESAKPQPSTPPPTKKSSQQVLDEYYYSFSLEQDVLLRQST